MGVFDKSKSVDHERGNFHNTGIKGSEWDEVYSLSTIKYKSFGCVVADKDYLCDFKVTPPTIQVSVISNTEQNSHNFTIMNILRQLKL